MLQIKKLILQKYIRMIRYNVCYILLCEYEYLYNNMNITKKKSVLYKL